MAVRKIVRNCSDKLSLCYELVTNVKIEEIAHILDSSQIANHPIHTYFDHL